MADVEFVEEIEPETDIEPGAVAEAVVYSSDWTTETLLSQLDRENISLNPRFQRRDAWTVARKSRLIESLIIGLPVPQIVLAELQGAKGRYLVLDGKQRLLTLLQFTGRGGESPNNAFLLENLDVRQDLVGLSYEDLRNDSQLQPVLTAFENYTIRTVTALLSLAS